MRMVFLSSRLPYPPEGGDRFRVFHLLRTASEAGHEVHLVSFDRDVPAREDLAPLNRILASVRVVSMPPVLSTFRSAQAIPGRMPLQAAYYRSNRMRRLTERVMRRVRPDLVYTHLFRMAPYALELMERYPARWVIDFTDVISAGIERSLPYRRGIDLWVYREEMRRIRLYEASIAPRFDECWVISEAERRTLAAVSPAARLRVVANGLVPEPISLPVAREPARLLFLGFHEVFHNRDAVRFLVQDVFPRVRAAVPEATLDIVGRGTETLGPWARGEGVRVVGYAPSLGDVMARATVFVAPHRFAAGVQNKVVQALASGMPVVTTTAVRLGLEPIPDGILRIAEDPAAIAGHVIALLRDPGVAASLGQRGYEWARTTFRWEKALDAFGPDGVSPGAARETGRLVAIGV
jgi:glycosyltransferase involved in cell wall biosynthesis